MKKVGIILVGALVLSSILTGCGSKAKVDSTQMNNTQSTVESHGTTPKIEEVNKVNQTEKKTEVKVDNTFNFKNVKVGDMIAVMKVSDIKNYDNPEKDKTINFSGEAVISGTYKAGANDEFGKYITLNLDEESQGKMPSAVGMNIKSVALTEENDDVMKRFGQEGKFKLAVKDYYVTTLTESLSRGAKISKIIEINKLK